MVMFCKRKIIFFNLEKILFEDSVSIYTRVTHKEWGFKDDCKEFI